MSNTTKQRTTRRHAKDSSQNRRVPSLRHHRATGQAYAVLNGKAVYFGRVDDPQAEQKYHQAIAEWLAAGKQLPVDPNVITVKEVLSRFWTHARDYYRTLTDGRVKELEQFRLVVRPLMELYGESRAADFGPRALKAVRQKMIDHGWCRPYITSRSTACQFPRRKACPVGLARSRRTVKDHLRLAFEDRPDACGSSGQRGSGSRFVRWRRWFPSLHVLLYRNETLWVLDLPSCGSDQPVRTGDRGDQAVAS